MPFASTLVNQLVDPLEDFVLLVVVVAHVHDYIGILEMSSPQVTRVHSST
jgi:hypothetical protein